MKRLLLITALSVITLMFSSCDSDTTTDDTTIGDRDRSTTSVKIVLTDLSVSPDSIQFSFANNGTVIYSKALISWTDGTTSGTQVLDSNTTDCTINSLSRTTKYTVTITMNDEDGNDLKIESFSVTTTESEALSFNMIYTAAELDAIRSNQRANYILMSDIDLSGYASGEGWQPIEWYSGTFNGNGHTISNLTINRPEGDNQGLFGYIDYFKSIKDLHLENVSITGNFCVGGMAGITRDSSVISSCSVSGNVTGNSDRVGGLVGWADGFVESCYSTASVHGEGTGSGSLVGLSGSSVSYCYASGNVSGNTNVGGLVGSAWAIRYSYATGTVRGARSVGGLAGGAGYSIVDNCYATGTVHSEGDLAGGLVGFSAGTIIDSYATGTVSGAGDVGGLVGHINFTITGSHATGTVQGTQWVGGLAGTTASEITTSYATGIVTCTGDYAGGLVSSTHGPITGSYATGTVSGINYVGGLAGITEIYPSTGDPVPVTNCYAMGEINGTDYVGGLVGSSGGDITNCYATGEVSGSNDIGGLLGSIGDGIITSCYFNDCNTGDSYNSYGTATSLANMTDQDTYIDWEFSIVWGISCSLNNGFPYLVVITP